MLTETREHIRIDLDQFKLHVKIERRIELSLHFDSPSRRFYLSVIALVVNEMKKLMRVTPIPLREHHAVLALLNETVGGSAGSSNREQLFPRIYRKWKGALPDLENAPLFRVLGKNKQYGDGIEKIYRFSEEEKDSWANLFEYKGSGENVRLRFSVDKIGVSIDDVVITYGDRTNLRDAFAWDNFIETLKQRKRQESKYVTDVNRVSKLTSTSKQVTAKKPSMWIGLLAILVLSISVITVYTSYLNPRPTMEPASLEKMALPLPDKPSIVVLPFENMTGDPRNEYLADGITENIITALSKIDNFFVISRTSSFYYKRKQVRAKQVSEELGVRYLLEGSFQSEGNRIRITAQLVDALKGDHIWAEKYDSDKTGILDVMDEITKAIVSNLRTKITRGEFARIIEDTQSFEAWDYTTQATLLMGRHGRENNARARELLELALDIDPTYIGALVLLSHCYRRDAKYGWSESRTKSMEKAVLTAERALALDESNGLTFSLLGLIYSTQEQYENAIAATEKAIILNPNLSDSYVILADTLVRVGRADEAVTLMKKAFRNSPHSRCGYFYVFGKSLWFDGQYEEALGACQKMLECSLKESPFYLRSAHFYLALTYSELEREEEARIHALEYSKLRPEGVTKIKYIDHPAYLRRLSEAMQKLEME
jgi:TolB-like protein/Flp pilus assembly protein TadD